MIRRLAPFPVGRRLALVLAACGATTAFVAPAARPVVGRRQRAAVVAPALRAAPAPAEAFEAAAIVRGATRFVRRLAAGGGEKRRLVRATLELVEPVDVATIAVLYALVCEDGVLARARRARGPADEFSLARALAGPARLLFCGVYPLFYAVDLACATLRAYGGVAVPRCAQPATAVCGYALTGGLLACRLKRYALARALPWARAHRARFDTLDRVGDAACWALAAALGLEALCLACDFRLASVLAFGGVGSLVLGLACQTPLANVVGGVIVAAVDPFDVGDEVDLGGDRAGYVAKMDWYTTTVRAYDNRVITVPNADIAAATTVNYSRMRHQRLATRLRLRRQDAGRVAALVADLRATLRAMPDATDDRAAGVALRVYLAGYDADTGGPEIDVEAHKRGGDTDDFLAWRERALLAVRAAVARQGCGLAHERDLVLRGRPPPPPPPGGARPAREA